MNETNENKLLFKFNSGLMLYLQGMKLSKQLVEEAINNKSNNEAFIHFYHFLCDMFALRENCGITDTLKNRKKEDSVFGALKNYYECIKHKNDYGKVQNINLFVHGSTFPLAFPFCFGDPYICFQSMSEEIAKLKYNDKNLKNYMIKIHDNHLTEKSLVYILEKCIDENEKLIKEKNK